MVLDELRERRLETDSLDSLQSGADLAGQRELGARRVHHRLHVGRGDVAFHHVQLAARGGALEDRQGASEDRQGRQKVDGGSEDRHRGLKTDRGVIIQVGRAGVVVGKTTINCRKLEHTSSSILYLAQLG